MFVSTKMYPIYKIAILAVGIFFLLENELMSKNIKTRDTFFLNAISQNTAENKVDSIAYVEQLSDVGKKYSRRDDAFELGAIFLADDLLQKSIEHFENALAIHPNYVPAVAGLVKAHWLNGNLELAEKYCFILIKEQPKNAAWLNQLANLYLEGVNLDSDDQITSSGGENSSKAKEVLLKAIEIKSERTLPHSYFQLAKVEFFQKQYQQASKSLTAAKNAEKKSAIFYKKKNSSTSIFKLPALEFLWFSSKVAYKNNDKKLGDALLKKLLLSKDLLNLKRKHIAIALSAGNTKVSKSQVRINNKNARLLRSILLLQKNTSPSLVNFSKDDEKLLHLIQ